ncbi:MAG: hypothetical protein ACHQ4F_08785 [Candidatus Dormibacteria bacterium]
MTLAGGLALVLLRGVSRVLKVSTDIVGYPTYANFNIERYVDYYLIAVVIFPIVALILYLAQLLLAKRLGLTGAVASRAAAVEPPTGEGHVTAAATSRLLAVGAVFALEAAIVANLSGGSFWVTLIAVTAAYAALVSAAGLTAQRWLGVHRSPTAITAQINTLASPLTFLGLFGVSAAQTVTVASDGSVHHYAWLPWWLAVAVTGVVVVWLWIRMSRAMSDVAIRMLERMTLLYLTAPLALFILLSQLIANPGLFDMFHEGEWLVAARLIGSGSFYWRDLLSTHGLFQDGFAPLIDMRLLQNSRWGLEAGRVMLLDPLAWVSLFVLLTWLCERSWAIVLAFFALIAVGQLAPFYDGRFIFWPLILVLLGVALQRRRWWLTVLVAICLVVQAILVPETAYCVFGCGLVVILHDLYHRPKGAKLPVAFAQTLWLTVGGVASFGVFCLYLISQRALGDFFFYYAVFAPGHELTGGVPLGLLTNGPLFPFLVFATPAALVLGFLYYAAAVIQRRRLDTRDWVVAASALFVLPYYTKFIDRADLGHVTQVLDVTYPLIAYLIYRACMFADSWLTRQRLWGRVGVVVGRQPVALALLLSAIASMMTTNTLHTVAPLPTWLMAAPGRYHQEAPTPPELATVGYGSGNGVDTATVADLATVFKAYLGPHDWVFDFSNEPALIYYVLGQTPHTRYYHMTIAIPELAQKDLIAELKRDPPKLVVFSTQRYGLLAWDDIPNMVRHYDVSQYILDNYTPLLSTHTQIIYALTSANLSPASAKALSLQDPALTDDLPFMGFACDWGYAPNFLSISPPPPVHQATPVTLSTTNEPNASITLEGWAGDPATGLPASRVVATVGGTAVGQVTPSIDRPDVAAASKVPGFATSGYRLTSVVPDQLLSSPAGMSSIRVFGISANGVASELRGSPGGAGTALTQITLQDGTSVPVRPGEVTGTVDVAIPSHQVDLSLPSGTAWSDYRWMEIDTSTKFAQDQWTVSDVQTGDPGHQIIFRTLPSSSSSFRVYVGSCAQWHGYQSSQLILSHGQTQTIAAIRLLP